MALHVRVPAAVAALLIAGGLGFLLGRFAGGDDFASEMARAREAGGTAGMAANPSSGRALEGAIESAQFGEMQGARWTEERILHSSRDILRSNAMFSSIWPLMQLVSHLQPEDMTAACQAAEKLAAETSDADVFGMLVWSRWAQLDPEGAAKHLEQHSSTKRFIDVRKEVILPVWAQRDRVAALQWAKSITSESERDDAFEKIFQAIARTDPDGAIALMRIYAPERCKDGAIPDDVAEAVMEFPGPDAARRFLEAGDLERLFKVAIKWGERDAEAALSWARGVPEGAARERAIDAVYVHAAAKDRATALAAVDEFGHAGINMTGTAERLIAEWPVEDTEGLRAWVMKMPQGPMQSTSLQRAASKLAQHDPKATAAWLETMPSSPARDGAVEAYASVILHRDGAAAHEWVATISDAGRRAKVMRELTQNWFRSNPAAAFQWMQSADTALSREEKQALLNPN